jgi:carboxypeptidase C (cathepsin A)
VRRYRGSVPVEVFIKERHRPEGLVASRYDGALEAPDPYPESAGAHGGDAILQGSIAPLTTAMVAELRQSLGFKTDLPYLLLNNEVARNWDWRSGGGNANASVADDLKEAAALNPRLKIMIAHGMTDLVTPYFVDRYLIDHLPSVQATSPIALKLYPGGHMMYLRPESRARLMEDARELYRARLG